MTPPERFGLSLVLVAAVWLSGCAASTAPIVPQPPPAPASVKVQTWTQSSRSGARKVAFVRNLTQEPVEVFDLTLYDCQNVAGSCGSSAPGLIVRPGQVVVLAEVRQLDRALPYSFQYTYGWRDGQTPR